MIKRELINRAIDSISELIAAAEYEKAWGTARMYLRWRSLLITERDRDGRELVAPKRGVRV